MISIKCVGGPHDGAVQTPPAGMKPVHLLYSMVDHGWGWEIDFSRATREETIRWGGADLAARAFRAVQNGRPVSFLGVEYTTRESLQAFEDALVATSYEIKVVRDDETGLEVQIVQPE